MARSRPNRRSATPPGGLVTTLGDTDWFGVAVTSPGDVDGDGTPDVAVGSPRDDDGGTDRGAVYVLLLDPDGTVRAEQKISETAGGLAATLTDQGEFGAAVAGIGDADGNGVPDLLVGAWQDDDGDTNTGSVHIVNLDAAGAVVDDLKISRTSGGLAGPIDGFDAFGFAVAGLGDLDDDGQLNIAVGAAQDDDGGGERGAVYVLDLSSLYDEVSGTVFEDVDGDGDVGDDGVGAAGVDVWLFHDSDGDGEPLRR